MGEIPAAIWRAAILQPRKAAAGALGVAPILTALIATVTGVAYDAIMVPSNLRAPYWRAIASLVNRRSPASQTQN